MTNARIFAPEFQAALDRYLAKINQLQTEYCERNGFNFTDAREVARLGGGQKYVAVYMHGCDTNARKHIHSFVATVDVPEKGIKLGDVLKPASFKAPEVKNPRGNIMDASERITHYGPVYLR